MESEAQTLLRQILKPSEMDNMAIQKANEMCNSLKPHLLSEGTKYVCDLCGAEFTSKNEANMHHVVYHTTDRAVLDDMIGRVYKNQMDDTTYRYIISIDYSNNQATVMDFRTTMFKKNNVFKAFHISSELTINTISISELKTIYRFWDYIPHGMDKIFEDIRENTSTMLDAIALFTGETNGN